MTAGAGFEQLRGCEHGDAVAVGHLDVEDHEVRSQLAASPRSLA